MTPKALSSSPRAELRAIRWFTLTHALGLMLFAALMAGFFWYLHHVEVETQRQALYRDIEWAQQSLRLKLRENQEEIAASIGEWDLSDEAVAATRLRVRDFLVRNPAAGYVARLDADRRIVWVLPAAAATSIMHRAPGETVDDSAGYVVFNQVRDDPHAAFSPPFLGDDAQLLVELHTPVMRAGHFTGTIAVGYSLGRILSFGLSAQVRERYQISITDQGGNVLVSSSPRTIHEANLGYELPLDPPGHGIRLRANAFETQPRFVERALIAAVVGLGIASLASLAMLTRHARRRIEAEFERDRLFSLSDDLMCVFETSGALLRVNPAFESLLGDVRDRRSLLALVHPEDRRAVDDALVRVMSAQSGAATFEARFRHGQAWRWLAWSLRGDPERTRRTLYAIAHDITERKNAETALAAETRFRQAMEESILTGMRAFDMEGRITYVNRAFCEMLGFTRDELIGAMPPYPYWPQGDESKHYENLEMILGGRAPASGFEARVVRKDGTTLYSRMYVSPLVDREGCQTGWMTSTTDITEPKRVREELAAAHERFTTVLDELDAAVWVAALPGAGTAAPGTAPLFTNRTFRQLFGSVGGELPVNWLDGSSVGWVPREMLQPRLGRWFEVRARQIRWVDGSPVRMLVATDVTRRHEAEEQQRQQDQKLQRTARLVTMGEMASSLAHELNQPLTAISNYCMGLATRIRSRVAQGQPVDADEMLVMLGKTAAQAERAGMVIRRIREFVKRSEPERIVCDVRTIVADAVGLAEIDAQRQGVRIDVTLPASLPTLHADPILVEQVLLNLIKNGIDAMRDAPSRHLEVAVVVRTDVVEFSVTDAGAGLDPAARDKLFEPFFTTKSEGMGMGLNICRSIVESHQGRLWVEPNDTQGCTFRFTIPLAGEDTIAKAA
ncbi:MAG: PAS domain S-box protein [Burkholderiaceae bacterium]